jgi:UDP-N-acetylmuramate dehydrogenase
VTPPAPDASAGPAREPRPDVPLAPRTTLRLGGPARRLVEATTADEVVEFVGAADAAGDEVLVLGGGSNLVLPDEGFPGLVVAVSSRGVTVERTGGSALVHAQSGEPWDPFVARTVDEGLAGLEALSGIPGAVGASPVQNIGAYGQEVAQTVESVRVYDRHEREVCLLPAADCGFGYRTSVFKGSSRWVVLEVAFRLEESPLSMPVRYGELARALGVDVGERAPLRAVREAVVALRRGKGMVVSDDDPDSVSAGSFFTNPVLDAEAAGALERRVAERLGPQVRLPRFPEPDGRVKVSAAWLIEQAGFRKGHGEGAVRVSTKHTLALTHRGGGTTAELLGLAREIREGVREAFGVDLVPEPVLVGQRL